MPNPRPNPAATTERPWLGVMFDCCRAYSRVYRNAQQDAYEGRCPRCRRHLRIGIGQGGTAQRFFTVR